MRSVMTSLKLVAVKEWDIGGAFLCADIDQVVHVLG